MPTRYNIAITPSEEIIKYSVEVSNLLAQKGPTYFVLDDKSFLPHISLYYAEFPEENLARIISALQQLAKELNSFTALITGYGDYQDYVGVALKKTEGVQELQHKVIESINPLREGIIRGKYQTEEYQSTLAEPQKQNILLFGYPTVGADWDPHLTLTRFKDIHLARKFSEELSWEISQMRIDTLGVYAMGNNGTCIKLLDAIPLKS
jgi:2'-5' RNA ligase